MIIQRFAHFVLKRRLNAILLAILFTGVPYLNWISGIIVGLTTLRKGGTEGFFILLWATLPALVMLFHNELWLPFVASIVYGIFLVWLLAIILRHKANWTIILYVTALFGVAGVLIMHAVVHDVAAWWLKYFNVSMTELEQAINIPTATETNIGTLLQKLSTVATGLQIMFFSLAAVIELFMARGLEATLFVPGRLAAEAQQIRMHEIASIIFIACVFLAKNGSMIFLDLLPVLLLPFVLAGISLIHYVMETKNLA